jgi:hypothetical protein
MTRITDFIEQPLLMVLIDLIWRQPLKTCKAERDQSNANVDIAMAPYLIVQNGYS